MKRSSFFKLAAVLVASPVAIAKAMEEKTRQREEFDVTYGPVFWLKRRQLILKIRPTGKRIEVPRDWLQQDHNATFVPLDWTKCKHPKAKEIIESMCVEFQSSNPAI